MMIIWVASACAWWNRSCNNCYDFSWENGSMFWKLPSGSQTGKATWTSLYVIFKKKIICKCAIFNIIHVCFPDGRYFGFRVTTSLGTRPTKQRLRRQSVEIPDGGWGGSVHDPSGCCARKLCWVYTQQISIELYAAFWIHNVCRTILPKTAGSTKPYPTVTFLCFFNYHVC